MNKISSTTNKKKIAFTLAEVLITLTILGIITLVTIPDLVHKFQDRVQITGVKRAYSLLENAFRLMVVYEGSPETWDWPDRSNMSKNNGYFMEKFSKYIPHRSFVITSDSVGPAWGNAYGNTAKFKDLNGRSFSWEVGLGAVLQTRPCASGASCDAKGMSMPTMVLNNGMYLTFLGHWAHSIDSVSSDTSSSRKRGYGAFRIDTNGAKGPNRLGYDVIVFAVNHKGLMLNSDWTKKDYCRLGILDTGNNIASGMGCGPWIIKKNNMKYKYKDIFDEW